MSRVKGRLISIRLEPYYTDFIEMIQISKGVDTSKAIKIALGVAMYFLDAGNEVREFLISKAKENETKKDANELSN